MVSRHHARIYWAGGRYVLEDLGSANGVFYQEQRVTSHPLKHGDAARCGSLWLRFVDPTAAQSVPHPVSQPVPTPTPTPIAQVPSQPMGHSGSGAQPLHTPTGQQAALQADPRPGVDPAQAAADAEELRRLKRRNEQLETELRLYRKGKGEEIAKNIERLQEKNTVLEDERDQLKTRCRELEATIEAEGSDAKARRADVIFAKTVESVQQLNDILSNLRINVMAAEGEFDQFAHELPRASFELIREALRSSSKDVDTARELLRVLRDLAG